MPTSNLPRRTLLLTGASRGIGHATVIRFSSAGWRVITCSRHAFPEDCPWDAGPEDHIQVDLSNPQDTLRAIDEIRHRLEGGTLHALVNNAAISPKGTGGARLGSVDTELATWTHVFQVNFFAPIMIARGLIEELKAAVGVFFRNRDDEAQVGLDHFFFGAAGIALAEALHASANREEARAALEEAVQRLRLRLADIQEPAARERFLTSVPANARVVALANEWLGLDVPVAG